MALHLCLRDGSNYTTIVRFEPRLIAPRYALPLPTALPLREFHSHFIISKELPPSFCNEQESSASFSNEKVYTILDLLRPKYLLTIFIFLGFRSESQEKRKSVKEKKLKEKSNITPLVTKYWFQRYDLFSTYDVGVKLDEEGWFSVTPEEIAASQGRRFAGAGVVIDAFAGVGGNAIQFAKVCYHVVAIEIDPMKVALASHNAKIYGVQDKIDFVVGDFFQLAPFLKGDVVFLSPPWGGPSYKAKENFTLDLLKPKDGFYAYNLESFIAFKLPRR
ncbi:trimethylguanosine synthase-like [Salvia splendens]|uniref:trimethylguanosine synthase-like n=1 Tax=Salvia splendens TaxID=180675 RepID=UPI001C266E83|nr:trimethylguanosine synthase-like [Salvia splendens]